MTILVLPGLGVGRGFLEAGGGGVEGGRLEVGWISPTWTI